MEQYVSNHNQNYAFSQAHNQAVRYSYPKFRIEDRTVQVLKFNFQIDELGNPWLLGIKGDMKFEQRSSQAFDDIKAHLLKEVVKVLERKVRE